MSDSTENEDEKGGMWEADGWSSIRKSALSEIEREKAAKPKKVCEKIRLLLGL